jgi:hypothetical protein
MIIQETFIKYGVAVIRNAFNIDGLDGLHKNLNDYKEEALKIVYGQGEPGFDHKKLVFNRNTLAADLSALDPNTKDYVQGDKNWQNRLLNTSLIIAMKTGNGWPFISAHISENIDILSGRVRAVHFNRGTVGNSGGTVFFHQEKHVISNWSLGYNLWMFLTPLGEIANITTPGIQFALGETEFWRDDHSTDFRETAQPKINILNSYDKKTLDSKEEFVNAGDYVLYRPHLHVGDIVVFDAHVLHASFVPDAATKARVSCEFRVHPK